MANRPIPLAWLNHSTLLNGLYAVAEYLAQPLGLLLTTPYLLRHLGAAQFGVWVLAGAAINSGNILSSGFGDAAVRYVSMYRGRGDAAGIARIVRGMISINLALGTLLALALWIGAPSAATRVVRGDDALRLACVQSFRIGSVLLIVRSLESVFASTLRALERYSLPVRIAVAFRVSVLIAAAALVTRGLGVVPIMAATLILASISAAAQGIALRAVAGRITLLPSIHRQTLSLIAGFGCFSWLQALSATVLGQADRLIAGMLLGAPAVAAYAICVQAAQTIHGIISSGFHVLFPHLSSRSESHSIGQLRHTVAIAFRTNLALSAILAAPLILLSRPILSLWMSPEFAANTWPLLSILACSFALFALNVTAHYAMLALGEVRSVTVFNFIAGAAMLSLMLLLTPAFGLTGTACARLVAGPITCLLYLPLAKKLRGKPVESLEHITFRALEGPCKP